MIRATDHFHTPKCRVPCGVAHLLFAGLLLLALNGWRLFAQNVTSPPPPSSSVPVAGDTQHLADIEKRLNEVTDALTQTQQTLQQSLLEIQRLRTQLDALRAEQAKLKGDAQEGIEKTPEDVVAAGKTPLATSSGGSAHSDLDTLREQQEILQAEVKQLDQTKVETASKYR